VSDVVHACAVGYHTGLIPLMHGLELVCFRCGIPAVDVSFLLIDCLVD
jgi:hypothetical protein